MIRLVTSRRQSENFAALKSQVVASTRASAGSKPRDLENDRGYRVPRAQAFTVSKASAALVKRRGPNSASIRRKKSSRSASFANSTATPRFVSGASVGTARKSLQLNPRKPGNVVQPNWYIIRGLSTKAGVDRTPPHLSPSRPRSPLHRLRSSTDTNPQPRDRSPASTANSGTAETHRQLDTRKPRPLPEASPSEAHRAATRRISMACRSAPSQSNIQVLDVESVFFDELTAGFDVFTHQRGENSSAATASSSFTWRSVRVSWFIVVSHNCSAFISPKPLNRVMVKSFLASSTT